MVRSPRLSGAKPVSRFSAHGEERKDVAPLRDVADAETRPLVRGEAAERLAVEADFAAGDSLLADDGAEEAGLADAVPAHECGDLAGLRRERHAAQRLGGAIVEIDLLRLEHHRDAPVGDIDAEVALCPCLG